MIKFTYDAFRDMTPKQKETIERLSSEGKHEMTITGKDFGLPKDWLSFRLTYKDSYTTIYGGISPEGEAHT